MRIGISTSVVQRGKTGVAQYVFALLRALLPHTAKHEFVLFVLQEDLPLFQQFASAMRIKTVAEAFRPPIKNILWHQRKLPRNAQDLKLDVLHIPSYRRLLWPRPCALVGTIHDLAPFHVRKKYSWSRMVYGKVVVPRLAARQHEIIAISRNTASDIHNFLHLPDSKVNVIYNGLDHARFSPGLRDQAKAAAIENHGLNTPFFLYIARLEHPAKNHVRLVEAFNSFKAQTKSDWKLVFGGSDWHGAEAIHGAVKSSPFSADIRSLGFVADVDLPTLYRAADVFVYPSLFEGFGMPPLEAMACGCPVICSTRGSLGEVVESAAAIVDPERVPSIAEKLTELAMSRETREKLIVAGLEQAKKFDWNRCASETLRVYEKARRQCS
jgi:glycosyltransferase involved in cell wall biosynthesis